MDDIVFWIKGEPASAKNSRRMVRRGKHSRLIKSEKALAYGELFAEQCPVLDLLILDDVSVRLDVWYASKRPDLAAMDYIQDLLQNKIYANDRQVKASMSVWNLDREEPRCLVQVRVLPIGKYENNSRWLDTNDMFGEYWECPETDPTRRRNR